MFLISYNPGLLYLTVVSCVLELNLCIAILTGFTDFVLKSGFRKNKVSLHPTLTQFGVSVHHQVKVGPFENTSGPELCLVFIYSGIRLAQTWPGVVSKCASLSWNCKKQKRKTFPAWDRDLWSFSAAKILSSLSCSWIFCSMIWHNSYPSISK